MTHYSRNHGHLGSGHKSKPTKATSPFNPPSQPANPYARDQESSADPEVDDITEGDEAQNRRHKMQNQEKAEGDR